MTKQTKGPATAPTVPSHGSNPEKGLTNMDSNTTQSAQGATAHRSSKGLMMDIEYPVQDAKCMASLLHRQLDEHFNKATPDDDCHHRYYLTPTDINDLIFTANMITKLVNDAISAFENAMEAMR